VFVVVRVEKVPKEAETVESGLMPMVGKGRTACVDILGI